MQTIPATNVYIHVNSDEADRILVDPAYKLERLKEAHEKLYAMHLAYKEVDKQLASQRITFPAVVGRDQYETWYNIELAIAKFDRVFNKVEKFNARKLSDPDNFDRRERRMLDAKKKRWTENYTYFFGGLTEEEQQYKDYFLTDIENDPENDAYDELEDRDRLAQSGEFDPKKYDFIETSLYTEVHENFEDIVEDKIFKYKYRQNGDDYPTYARRQKRMVDRFLERARTRDGSIEANLDELYAKNEKTTSLAAALVDQSNYGPTAKEGTDAIREYMVKEGVQQYRDYYETDSEEQGFFEYLDNMANRDRIRFMELFEDFTQNKGEELGYAMIPKREFNPELSAFSNLLLDLVDFRDRVKPMANDLARLDVSRTYQRRNANEVIDEHKDMEREMKEMLDELRGGESVPQGEKSVEEGYSSIEIAAESGAEDAATPDLEAAAAQNEEEKAEQEDAEDSTAQNEEEKDKKDE